MNILDFIVFPIFVVLILVLVKTFVIKNIDESLRDYFYKGLYIKLFSSLATGLIYWYYYGAGDTIYYYERIELLRTAFGYETRLGLKILFGDPKIYDPETVDWYFGLNARDGSNWLVVRLGYFVSLFTLNIYSLIALVFSLFSYSGVWKLYVLFMRKYPNVSKKHLAYTTLYLPSVFFWGSGLFKDTVTLGCLCWVVVIIDDMFTRKRFSIFKLIFLAANIYAIGVIKSYILLALIPALLLWAYKGIKLSVKSKFVSSMLTPILIGLGVIVGIFVLTQLSSVFTKFSIDNVASKAEGMQRWHTVRGDQKGGNSSTYSLGHISFTPVGMLMKAPAAINVAIFRPYLWESTNPIVILASIESQIFLFIFIRYGLFRFFPFVRMIRNDSFLTFSLVFSLIFAFSVGFTSFNFGALVRYKIPFLPFFSLILVMAYHSYHEARKKKEELKVVEEVPQVVIGND